MNDLIELLSHIPPSSLEYQEWVNVGMALKHEGYPVSVWDDWSRADGRYKEGLCEKKWGTFREDSDKIVTGGTIHELAMRFGYTPQKREVKVFDWEDEILYDGDPEVIVNSAWLDTSNTIEQPKDFIGTDQLRRYLQILFKPDEIVGFCVDAEYDEDRKKWSPSTRGVYGMTAKQILEAIKKHPKDIEAVIGDYKKEAGAWIRFNPLDGTGVQNTNVTDLRYALIESDSLELERQKALMEELKLPIAVMVYSGAKSIHSIVRVDAVNIQDYREKVDYLYRICEKNGLLIDKQNKNPSRMSRMPGVERGEKKQFILAENIGCKTFDEWKEYIEDSIDTYPDIVTFSDLEELPPLAPELIEGILRKGHKMLISGASKAGKSFLLIELAICVTTGKKWLGSRCKKGRVLYVNLEVDGASFLHRVESVKEVIAPGEELDLDIWNLRGENAEINKLAPRLVRRAQNKDYSLIILDPLYKINEGDENSASEMAKFFNKIDYIGKQLGVSIACCHHHSKGSQGGKFSIDRASGSGVFARDPDALLDMIQIDPRDVGKTLEKGQTAWRISSTLREFETPEDIDVIFTYPVHRITDDLREAMPLHGMDASTNAKRGGQTTTQQAEERYQKIVNFVNNWEEYKPEESTNINPTIGDVKAHFNGEYGFKDEDTIKKQIMGHDDFVLQKDIIFPKPKKENLENHNSEETEKKTL